MLKLYSPLRSQELAELRQFELLSGGLLRPMQKLLLWENARGNLLNPVIEEGLPLGTDHVTVVTLPLHTFVHSIECDFSAAPGLYRIDYVRDIEGHFLNVHEIPESEWIPLARGRADFVLRFAAGDKLSLAEGEKPLYHSHCPVFCKFLRIVDRKTVTAVAVRVFEEKFTDMTARIVGDISWTEKLEARTEARFVRPEFSFALTNYDRALDLHGTTDLHDGNGLTKLCWGSRWQLCLGYFGPDWERPRGFENSGYWPKYFGNLFDRGRSHDLNGRVVTISCRGGEKALGKRSLTTQPLWERKRPLEFVRDQLTVSDDGERRLIGVNVLCPPGKGTSYEEFVGFVRMFEENWNEPVAGIETPERLHGMCTDGLFLYCLILDHAEGEYIPEGFDIAMPVESWWIVKLDFDGNEVERQELLKRYCGPFGHEDPGRLVETTYCDICFADGKLVLTLNTRSRNADGSWTDFAYKYLEFWTAARLIDGLALRRIVYPFGHFGACFAMQLPDVWYIGVFSQYNQQSGMYPQLLLFDLNGELVSETGGIAGVGFVPRTGCGFQTFVNSHGEAGYTIVCSGRTWKTERNGFLFGEEIAQGGVQVFRVSKPHGSLNLDVVVEPSRLTADNRYACVEYFNGFILAGGFGPEGFQGIAKAAQLRYWLENALVRSEARGDVPVLNFAELRLRGGGDVLAENDLYAVDHAGGQIHLLKLLLNGLELRASYDYEPTFSLVPMKKELRWDLASELAYGFGLHVTVDAFDCLSIGAKLIEERIVFRGSSRSWILGSSIDADGVPYIVADTIEVRRFARDGALVDAADYSLTSAAVVTKHGESALTWTVTSLLSNGLAEEVWVICFRVQQTVLRIGRQMLSDGGKLNTERMITKAIVTSSRRVPTVFAQRIEKIFAVAPRTERLESSFDRLQPVETTGRYEWRPPQKIFEKTDPGEKPVVHVAFNEPLLLGSSRFGVVYGKLPYLHVIAPLATGSFGGKRFLKVNMVNAAANENYHVWFYHPGSFRVAAADDFDDMAGNCTGGDPVSAADVKTANHFYILHMNTVSGSVTYVAAWEEALVYYQKDSLGRIAIAADNLFLSAEERFLTAFPEKAVTILLRPQDGSGVPLVWPPIVELGIDGVGAGLDAAMAIDDVVLSAEGIKINVNHPGRKTNFLAVEVVGYPVLESEKIIGIAYDNEAAALYGEQEKPILNRFVPNGDYAVMLAGRTVARRSVEPEPQICVVPLKSFAAAGDVAEIVNDDGSVTLKVIEDISGRRASAEGVGSTTEFGLSDI